MANEFPPDTSNPPAIGNAIFYKDCRPPLEAGHYALRLSQSMTKDGTRLDDQSQYPLPGTLMHKFEIAGPRFTLDPGEIHAAYPPPNSEGPFAQRLPMIVLRRRTLPWERTIDATGTPWLALLLFEEGEAALLDPPNFTVANLVDADTANGVHALGLNVTADERKQACLGVQVSLSTFHNLAPMPEEVSLLTHVRQVNTEDKELLGMDKDGWFAVVIGNRLPRPGKKYNACLVSLEGHRDHLPTAHAELTAEDLLVEAAAGIYMTGIYFNVLSNEYVFALPQPSLRLCVLARWEFKCTEQGEDFEALLDSIPERGGVAMVGMSPQDAVAPGAQVKTAYKVALESGHVPLVHQTREGATEVAWYRGPLVPGGVKRETGGPYHSADQARRIDPLSGLENLGYAAAFEIGRLLALSDPQFALELLRWRRGGHVRVTQAIADGQLAIKIPSLIPQFDPREVIDPRLLITDLIDQVSNLVRNEVVSPQVDPTGMEDFRQDLIGLDAATVAQVNGFEQNAVERIFGESLAGESHLLETLGIEETLALDGDFQNLVQTAELQFGHLAAGREKISQIREGMA